MHKSNGYSGIAEYTMIVEEAFKGIKRDSTIVVHTNTEGTYCGLPEISVGAQWQMWVYEGNWTDSCTRSTSNYNQNRAELEEQAKRIAARNVQL
ncbi:unnamed protein product [Rotaria sp. Silwood1]|nr:unnamed protein product [Rotaria sp. Silwood1]